MEFGVGYFPTHDGIGPGEVARKVEERGQNAIYFAEHTHIPAARDTPAVGGGELPRKYAHTYDLFVAMTAAATATSSLRIGRGTLRARFISPTFVSLRQRDFVVVEETRA